MAEPAAAVGSVLLLSGGLDSTAVAALLRPRLCLFVDYGQVPAAAERRAAETVAGLLGLRLRTLVVDLRAAGGGLLAGRPGPAASPSPEWWPYRNQLLVTLAAAVALSEGLGRVLIGTVAGDGARHADGRPEFYDAMRRVLAVQEGAIDVDAPANGETTQALVLRSGLAEDVLGWTVSCHRSDLPCGQCPGCHKRSTVLTDLGLLRETP